MKQFQLRFNLSIIHCQLSELVLKHSKFMRSCLIFRRFVAYFGMKHFLSIFSLVFICSITHVFGQVDTSKYQLLWEIKSKNNNHVSYLFGSMHSNDSRMFNFPDTVYQGFINAQTVVVETDVAALFETYDVRLDAYKLDIIESLNKTDGTRTAYGSEDGRPQFLDAYFQECAYAAGKKVVTLETFEEQLAASEKISASASAFNFGATRYTEEMFVDAYLKGDIVSLTKMLKAQLNGSPETYDAFISKRNKSMANGLDTLMRKSNVFCVIGSGHLYGNDGVVQLLRNKGFTVRRVNPIRQENCEARNQMQAYNSYTHKNTNYHFEITLSGKPLESKDNGFYKALYVELGQGNTYEVHVSEGESDLEGCKMEFIVNQHYRPVELTLEDGTYAIEGIVKSRIKGYQWKRIFVKNGFTYELICYGGNKFMHSKRPQTYFNRFQVLPK